MAGCAFVPNRIRISYYDLLVLLEDVLHNSNHSLRSPILKSSLLIREGGYNSLRLLSDKERQEGSRTALASFMYSKSVTF